jgi:hypothetical protein
MINVAYANCYTVGSAFITSLQVTLYSQGFLVAVYLLMRMIHSHGFIGATKLQNWKRLQLSIEDTDDDNDGYESKNATPIIDIL